MAASFAATLLACGGSPAPDDGGGDATPVDAGSTDAGAPESCPTPSATRTQACGMCGIASQTCGADGFWAAPGACLSEGECADGHVETDTAMCGMRTRICDDTCHWRAWTVMTPAGECDAGAMDTGTSSCGLGEMGARTCDATCHWGASMCVSRCSRAPHASRTGADPVCIPHATFVLGDDGTFDTWHPSRQVTLTADSYLDRVPVTKSRYAACVTAGVCPSPEPDSTYSSAAADEVITLSNVDGDAFCTWDGGQVPSEFRWALAARGPAPDTREDPWGTTSGDPCQYHPDTACTMPATRPTQYPLATSMYGLQMLGLRSEITSTAWTMDYSYLAAAVTDPSGPAPTGNIVLRGYGWCDSVFMTCNAAPSAVYRLDNHPDFPVGLVRCEY